MTLITRQAKGSKLTIQEMDGNLEYLQSLSATTVLTTYPETTPSLAGTRFWYKGNEWHYMTQAEIDSIEWTGLVNVGFPAPVIKNMNRYILYDNINFTNTAQIDINSGGSFAGKTFILDFLGLGDPTRQTFAPSMSTGPGSEFNLSIRNAHLLKNLEDIGTMPAMQYSYANLTATAINQLFTDLPSTTKTATINVRYNPGSATCDPTIATAKGYIVVTN
jgi:hypothetical protein